MSEEGHSAAPIRHNIAWRDEAYYDAAAIEAEMERVFDICHGCRRCFNLCESFPILFDMIDESPTGELDGVPKSDYAKVVEACTLCDMCFMTKCPYVPPHEFDLDFPHLMLRARAADNRAGKTPFTVRQLAETERNGKLAKPVAPLANALSSRKDRPGRIVLEAVSGIDKDAELPRYASHTLLEQARKDMPRNENAPAKERKAVLFATCFGDYNKPETGLAALKILARNGVETAVIDPGCCGMPFLEHGDIARVAKQAQSVSSVFSEWIDKGYDPVVITASCSLMLKFEWPLILPENEDVKRLSEAVYDIDEYIVDIAAKEGLAEGLSPIEGGISVHMACHARAQNMGPKAAQMLRLIPDTKVDVIERCSGHGGTFGIMKKTRPYALEVAKPAVRTIKRDGNAHLCSDCPLACKHLVQVLQDNGDPAPAPKHPVELLAMAYGL